MRPVLKNALARRALAAVAGLLVPLGFAPFHFYPLPVLSLAVLFYLWLRADSAREAFILGYLFGLAMFGLGVYWLHISINLFGGVNLIGAWFFTGCLVAIIALYPAVCGYLCRRFYRRYRLLAPAPLWTLTEWGRGWLLTGFPWLNLGVSQTDGPLAGYAPLIGAYGLSFIVAATAAAGVGLLGGRGRARGLAALSLAVIVAAGLPLKQHAWTDDNGQRLNVALIQGAIPQELKWRAEMRRGTYEIYTALSAPHWSADLIIWPETAIPSLYQRAADFIAPLEARLKNTDTLFMSGLAYKNQASGQYHNSILLLDDGHRFYHKHHLVPFGEYLPLKPLLGGVIDFLRIPMSDFSAGDPARKLLPTARAVFGMSICYEAAYDTAIRRSLPAANILINVSNDAWFGDSMAPHQHLQIARMRALESGRYLLRATNNGISAIIDNRGRVVQRSPQFEPHALRAEVKLFEGATPYSRHGNSLIVLIALGLALLGAVLERKGRG